MYDSWGKLASISGPAKDTIGVKNPFRYRGYYYDTESGLYYANSRYYDPETSRFVNTDTTNILTATPKAFTDKNLYNYCDNNSVIRLDKGGEFWERVWYVVSLGSSIIEVAVNPSDPWAWAGLVGDVADVLIPGVGGIGETVRAISKTRKVADRVDNIIDAAKWTRKTADKTSPIRKATGSYEITYKSGKNYVGKGGFMRAINSAQRNSKKYSDPVMSITWKSAPNSKTAFYDEYRRMRVRGVDNDNTYNKIWSPGRSYYYSDLERLFRQR